jgi:hypothetical protein
MGLVGNPAIRDGFPPFAAAHTALQAARSSGGCASCGQRPTGVDVEGLKAYLAGLPDAAKARFKQLCGAPSVTISYRAGQRVETITF